MLRGQIDKINKSLSETLVRRLLVKYFMDRGYGDSFSQSLFPPILQDLSESVPEIGNEIEVIPYVESVDPQTGHGRVGWNLFALGNRRLFLGETEHANMNDLARQMDNAANGVFDITENSVATDRTITPAKVVNFLTRVLSSAKHAVRSVLPPDAGATAAPSSKAAPLAGRGMFNHNRPARGEM